MQLQESDYTVMVEESTRAALADILTHQYKEKKEKKEPKSPPPPTPPRSRKLSKHLPSTLMELTKGRKVKQQQGGGIQSFEGESNGEGYGSAQRLLQY